MLQLTLFKVYKGNFSQKTGTDCPAILSQESRCNWAAIAVFYTFVKAIVCFALIFLSVDAYAQISLPKPPSAAPVPLIPKEREPVKIRQEEKKDKSAKEAVEIEKKVETLKEKKIELEKEKELNKPRELYGFMETSLIVPKVSTSGDRSNYSSDATVHVNFWGRMNPTKKADTAQFWAGLRVAPFQGSGKQGNQTGRYALTYVGPGLGLGRVIPTDDAPTATQIYKSGWLLSIGFSAASQMENPSDHPDVGENDFSSMAWNYDLPGVWSEYRYINMFLGAMSYNFIAGCQLGRNKKFGYLGVGLGGWL